MKKSWLLFSLTILTLATLACTITMNLPVAKAGVTQIFSVDEALPGGAPPHQVVLNMGAGELELTPGAKGLIEGAIRYNLEDWKPQILRTSSRVTISQEFKDLFVERPINEWKLKLGSSPLDLQVKAGAYSAKMNLGGIPLTYLEISEGASQTNIQFDRPNPEVMRQFRYTTGGSKVELKGLVNANFKEMRFEGAAGSYTLDFSSPSASGARLNHSASVTIRAGVCNLQLVIPKGIAARIRLSSGFNNITTEGTWTVNGMVYQTAGDGPELEINIETGIGNLALINK